MTDVLMPAVRGPELARRLRLRRPGLPVLFVSGFVDDASLVGERLLTKPFRADELLDAVVAALGSAAHEGAR